MLKLYALSARDASFKIVFGRDCDQEEEDMEIQPLDLLFLEMEYGNSMEGQLHAISHY